MSFPRYPKYKDSGVEWLGNVPSYWTTPPVYLRYEAVLGKMLNEKQFTGGTLFHIFEKPTCSGIRLKSKIYLI